MNVVMPMAGEGTRFKEAGYTCAKPFLPVDGVPMWFRVVQNLGLEASDQLIVLCRSEHVNLIPGSIKKVAVEKTTEGSACTVLLAKELINNNEPLLIVNSDQIIDFNSNNWKLVRNQMDLDGAIWVFEAGDRNLKWSYASFDEYYQVKEVAEKQAISNWATCGVYYWSRGSDFVKYAERMIAGDRRTLGEFYNCPVYQEAIRDKMIILPFFVEKMTGLGTPEDYSRYIRSENAVHSA